MSGRTSGFGSIKINLEQENDMNAGKLETEIAETVSDNTDVVLEVDGVIMAIKRTTYDY